MGQWATFRLDAATHSDPMAILAGDGLQIALVGIRPRFDGCSRFSAPANPQSLFSTNKSVSAWDRDDQSILRTKQIAIMFPISLCSWRSFAAIPRSIRFYFDRFDRPGFAEPHRGGLAKKVAKNSKGSEAPITQLLLLLCAPGVSRDCACHLAIRPRPQSRKNACVSAEAMANFDSR